MTSLPRIKVCGITNLHDAQLAADEGAWTLGMIFWDSSPRRCDPAEAQAIGAALRRRVELAGVFVNASLDEIAATAQAVPLAMIQLHGDEGPSFCAEIRRRTGAKVCKATRVRSRAELQAATAFHTDYHLLDAHVPGVPGGTGATFDWELARTHRFKAPVILSGGLTHANVAQAIAIARPFAVDVASGTEREPGLKDPAKLAAFVAAVRATAPDPEPEAHPQRERVA